MRADTALAAPPPRWRRLLGPGVATLAMLAVLIGLGNWQIRRLAWKEALLAEIDHAEASPALPLPPGLPDQFMKIRVAGTWQPGFALYGADVRDTPTGPQMGGQLLQVLRRPDGPPVLIDRGWVPEDAAASWTAAGPAGIDGFVRQSERPGWLSATDDSGRRRFYTLDPAAIGAALGVERISPFTVVALGPAGALPAPAQALPRPPNDHLSYALTWYGLALVLLAVFFVWSRKVLRT
jgi:surfeit locus 1 family protein